MLNAAGPFEGGSLVASEAVLAAGRNEWSPFQWVLLLGAAVSAGASGAAVVVAVADSAGTEVIAIEEEEGEEASEAAAVVEGADSATGVGLATGEVVEDSPATEATETEPVEGVVGMALTEAATVGDSEVAIGAGAVADSGDATISVAGAGAEASGAVAVAGSVTAEVVVSTTTNPTGMVHLQADRADLVVRLQVVVGTALQEGDLREAAFQVAVGIAGISSAKDLVGSMTGKRNGQGTEGISGFSFVFSLPRTKVTVCFRPSILVGA